MIIVGVIISLALLGVIVRFALSKKTEKLVKWAAIIALAAISLAIIVCLIMIVSGPGAVEEEPVFSGLPLAEPVQTVDSDAVFFLVFGIIMLLFLGFIIFFSMKDKKKRLKR
jgi:amino acid transporter